MWPSRAKATKADAVIAIMDEAAEFAANKWTFYNQTVPFRENVSLIDRITAFLPTVILGLKDNFIPLKNAPAGVVLMIVARGICLSGTYSEAEVEKALGIQLPEWKT